MNNVIYYRKTVEEQAIDKVKEKLELMENDIPPAFEAQSNDPLFGFEPATNYTEYDKKEIGETNIPLAIKVNPLEINRNNLLDFVISLDESKAKDFFQNILWALLRNSNTWCAPEPIILDFARAMDMEERVVKIDTSGQGVTKLWWRKDYNTAYKQLIEKKVNEDVSRRYNLALQERANKIALAMQKVLGLPNTDATMTIAVPMAGKSNQEIGALLVPYGLTELEELRSLEDIKKEVLAELKLPDAPEIIDSENVTQYKIEQKLKVS